MHCCRPMVFNVETSDGLSAPRSKHWWLAVIVKDWTDSKVAIKTKRGNTALTCIIPISLYVRYSGYGSLILPREIQLVNEMTLCALISLNSLMRIIFILISELISHSFFLFVRRSKTLHLQHVNTLYIVSLPQQW